MTASCSVDQKDAKWVVYSAPRTVATMVALMAGRMADSRVVATAAMKAVEMADSMVGSLV